MAAPAKGNSYPWLAELSAPEHRPVRMALQALFDQVAALQRGSQAMKGPPDMGRNRVRNMADPVDATDGVTKGHMDAKLLALEKKLSALNVQNLNGRLAQPQIPLVINIDPAAPLPDKTIALPGMLVRHGAGVLKFFDPETSEWEDV